MTGEAWAECDSSSEVHGLPRSWAGVGPWRKRSERSGGRARATRNDGPVLHGGVGNNPHGGSTGTRPSARTKWWSGR